MSHHRNVHHINDTSQQTKHLFSGSSQGDSSRPTRCAELWWRPKRKVPYVWGSGAGLHLEMEEQDSSWWIGAVRGSVCRNFHKLVHWIFAK